MSEPVKESLAANQLRRACDPARLGFATTDELADLDGLLGQDRACAALEFGTSLRAHDYNVFALGSPGVGKHAIVRKVLAERAAQQPVPSDWCYVHDFKDRTRPRALRLPAGRGSALQRDVANLLEEIRAAIPRALESEELRAKIQAVEDADKKRREAALGAVRADAEASGVAVVPTPGGMALAAVRDDQIVGPDEFKKLPQEDKDRYEAAMTRIGAALEAVLKQAPRWRSEAHATIRKLGRDASSEAVQHLVDELATRWSDQPEVKRYLEELRADVIENGDAFISSEDGPGPNHSSSEHELPILRRYRVNVLVDNGGAKAAPVVHEDHPTHARLFGRIEHVSVLGALLTDFNLVRAGAIHRANGGYLVVDALELLRQPWSWPELKRTLRARSARIESPIEELGLASTVSLSPQPIPLDVKVVLVGDRSVYHALSSIDPEFHELFKIAADFEDDVAWKDETLVTFARLVATTARREKVRPLDAAAVALVIEQAARDAEDRERLSLDLQAMSDLLREADHCAARAGARTIGGAHVREALDGRVQRSDRYRELVHDQIRRGTLMVDVDGTKVGQLNGLSLVSAGDWTFARPTRITARARLGRGEVIDVEREVELGGPLHSKGVLILEAFLASRYASEMPFALSATLVIEQSYGGIEGDSASLAELCALVSAIGEVPLDQSLAVTGSVNQHGIVQPVGGVNEKIEGFFDACKIAGLTGRQGVLLPKRNVSNLMLRPEVVEAVQAGKFHVHAVDTVDEALALLAGKPAGERGEDGEYPDETVNGIVQNRLALFAAAARAYELPDSEIAEMAAEESAKARGRRLIIGGSAADAGTSQPRP